MHFPYSAAHDFPLFLAPMAGVSESPFRQICRRYGADVVVSEFISSVGISLGIERVVTELFEPDFVDINFGCPVKKVVRNNGGSGCLKDMNLVRGIIGAVRDATRLPVTVNIGSGWDETQRDPVDIALRCQDAGALALTLHPRTRTQMYHGAANWDEIAAVAAALTIPVIGNGDIRTPADVLAMRQQTNCAGIMIARGSFGNPWLFAQARDLLAGRAVRPDPTPAERFSTALEHARLALRLQGDTRKTALEFRKHFGWYTRGLPGASELRQRLFAIESMAEAEEIFSEYLFGSVRSAA